jgi:hypothetical protein
MMSAKKFFLMLLLLSLVGVFAAVSYSPTQAAAGLAPDRHPPACVPINFFVEGYWGMYCMDPGNDIASVALETKSPYSLAWDNTYAQMIVELDGGTAIFWQVCDGAGACAQGSFPQIARPYTDPGFE